LHTPAGVQCPDPIAAYFLIGACPDRACSSGEVDFDEFYEWWKEHLELAADGGGGGGDGEGGGAGVGGLGGLYTAKKRSFLGGDADVALMIATSNGRAGCEQLLVDAGAQMDQEMKLHAIEMMRVNEAQQARGGFYCSSCALVSSLPSPSRNTILTTSNGVFPCQAAVEAQFEAAAQLEARKSKKGTTPTRQPKVGSEQNEETKSSVCAVQ
jgi:hypothetical protein